MKAAVLKSWPDERSWNRPKTVNIDNLSALVVVASYGRSNDRYLEQLIGKYQNMSFRVDIVVLSNVTKPLPPNVELRVGLPDSNPWSLPFGHKAVFEERANEYDIFVYSEDDILLSEENLNSFLDVAEKLKDCEIPGFVRAERDSAGSISYPDIHSHFKWEASSVVRRGGETFAFLSNEHAACYVLTKKHLQRAIASGGFTVGPHEWQYDLLCTAATDPYTQCGFRKLIPISRFSEFTVEHLSNKYVGTLGMPLNELRCQVGALERIAESGVGAEPGFINDTKLQNFRYSKDLYAEPSVDISGIVGPGDGLVLSIGCGAGTLESGLTSNGWRVFGVPIDPVMATSPLLTKIEVLSHVPQTARKQVAQRQFDWIIAHNVLHLTPHPIELLALFSDLLSPSGRFLICSPNMMYFNDIPANLVAYTRNGVSWSYNLTGAHFATAATIRRWCRAAGLAAEKVVHRFPRRARRLGRLPRHALAGLLASDLAVVAARPRRNYI